MKPKSEKVSCAKVLEEVVSMMCDGYCKYPAAYLEEYKNPEVAHEMMIEQKCSDCPLDWLI